jgi:Trk-type K+ transport system membrane component
MHFHKATHILGLLLIFLSIFMLLHVPFSLYYGGNDASAFLISAALSLVAGLIAYKTTSLDGDLRPKKGFAVVTFAWPILSFFGSLRRHPHPPAVIPVRMNGEPVSREVVTNVLGYFIFYYIFPVRRIVDVVAQFGHACGLPRRGGDPGQCRSWLRFGRRHRQLCAPACAGKWLLSLYMLLGRLEISTVIVLFSPDAWRK